MPIHAIPTLPAALAIDWVRFLAAWLAVPGPLAAAAFAEANGVLRTAPGSKASPRIVTRRRLTIVV